MVPPIVMGCGPARIYNALRGMGQTAENRRVGRLTRPRGWFKFGPIP
jgi:hypothetical protein